ncbi:MAG: quinoprotein dehydrogenase-associated putative ABC transporter substrate-binding protein [Terriglobales bacterium]
MCSPFRSVFVFSLIFTSLCGLACARDLRVCADPDNLPFSNQKQQGFENKIAEIVARDLNARLVYVWQRMGRGFVREYLDGARCDLLVGIPKNFKPVLTTTPYYRSSYVFVTRPNSNLKLASLDDPALHTLKIGVQVLDEDYTPPATALARRGLQSSIVGFDTTGEDADSIIRAVVDRKVDTAIVWGPLAGFYANKFPSTLELTPVTPQIDPPNLPLTFEISFGVRRGNIGLRDELETVLERKQSEVRSILNHYGVPQLDLAPASTGGS